MCKPSLFALVCAGAFLSTLNTQAQVGPFPPGAWPLTAKPGATVHFTEIITEGVEPLAPLSESWTSGLNFLSGGDQNLADLNIGGFAGKKTIGQYFNVADRDYTIWNNHDTIDILMQVYGDSALLSSAGAPKDFNFLIGTLPAANLQAPSGGKLPVEANNQQWNWVLFRIENTIFDPANGFRRVGTKHPDAPGGSDAGGVNGGTIRLQNIENFGVRVVAWGEKGAFGKSEDVNLFTPREGCDPEPETNLASIDFATASSSHIQVLTGGDQQTTQVDDVGPANDKRKAIRPVGTYINFAITDDYLGKKCNEPRSVKVCVDFFDDEALVGTEFGPEAYATDAKGGVGFVKADQRQTLAGSGQWVRRSWIVPAVSLAGVNVAPLTAGPRFFCSSPVSVSRFAIAVLRTGTHPLAGQDPLEDCFSDPLICTGAYGSYADRDLASGNLDGLAPGTSGGDQVMIQREAGPDSDRRLSIAPAFEEGPLGFRHDYLNLAITGEKLGPNSQPNARLGICVTYFDAADSVGKAFRPEVWFTEASGANTFAFSPGSLYHTLQGSDTWKEAYFELNSVKFNGVNQGPQAAARFHFTGKIYVSRVQYAVIRPCGVNAGVNALEACKPPAKLSIAKADAGKLRIAWPRFQTGYALESSSALGSGAVWTTVVGTPVNEEYETVMLRENKGAQYYRLRK